MEVILLADVKNVGKKDEIVKVSDGYARNCLLHKNLGVEATPKNLNDLKIRQKNQAKLEAEQLAEAKAMAERIEKISVTVTLKTGEGGRAFGAISAKEVAEALKTQQSINVDKKKLVMQPIKGVGSFTAGVKLHPQVTADLKVNVVEG